MKEELGGKTETNDIEKIPVDEYIVKSTDVMICAIKNNIKEKDIMEFALYVLQRIPDYFFIIPASSSGKYHPKSDLGRGGLVRHTLNVLKVLNYIMEIEQCDFTDREKDLMRVAALFHDSVKSGFDYVYEENTSSNETRPEHPYLAWKFIIDCAFEYSYPFKEATFIAEAIVSHMGQWNKSKYDSRVLPKPETKWQKTLHLADYIASRKDINIDQDFFLPQDLD